jgi:hypothetical protein
MHTHTHARTDAGVGFEFEVDDFSLYPTKLVYFKTWVFGTFTTAAMVEAEVYIQIEGLSFDRLNWS